MDNFGELIWGLIMTAATFAALMNMSFPSV